MNDEAAALLQKLRCAESDNTGATLTHRECHLLLGIMKLPRPRKPRKPRKRNIIPEIRHDLIAVLCALHCVEIGGKLTKVVAGKIGDLFKVSRSHVFGVRNKNKIDLKGMDSKTRRALIANFEKGGLGWYTCKVVRQVRAQEFLTGLRSSSEIRGSVVAGSETESKLNNYLDYSFHRTA